MRCALRSPRAPRTFTRSRQQEPQPLLRAGRLPRSATARLEAVISPRRTRVAGARGLVATCDPCWLPRPPGGGGHNRRRLVEGSGMPRWEPTDDREMNALPSRRRCVSADLLGAAKDHAVAVSRHDATPLTSEELVHHLHQWPPGRRCRSGTMRKISGTHRPDLPRVTPGHRHRAWWFSIREHRNDTHRSSDRCSERIGRRASAGAGGARGGRDGRAFARGRCRLGADRGR
jgi:hypothetical protein